MIGSQLSISDWSSMPRNEHQFDKPTEGRIFLEMEGADPTGLTLDVVVSYPYEFG